MIDGVRRLMRLPLFTRRNAERQVDDEIAFHLTARAERLVDRGMAPADAQAEATRRFGPVDAIRDQCMALEHRYTRQTAVETLVEELVTDIRFGARSLRRSPGLTSTALLTLVLGTASITTVFSIVNAAWRPLPFPDSDRIVALSQAGGSFRYPGFSTVKFPVADLVRTASHSFERLANTQERYINAIVGAEASQLAVISVDTGFRAMLGTPTAVGRWLTADDILGDAPVIVISDNLWHELGGTQAVFDRPFRLDARFYTIVGVMPPGFGFPERTSVWRPLVMRPEAENQGDEPTVGILAKLRPGVTKAAARLDLRALSSRLPSVDPRFAHDSLIVRDEMLDRGIRPLAILMLAFFLCAGLFVLLIVCTNVATLMVARTAERQTEMAVRSSLGAGRWRLTRQMLAESFILAMAAGLLGTLGSIAGVRILLAIVPTVGFPSWLRFGVDIRVLAFSVAVSLFVTVMVSLLPVRVATRLDLVSALKHGSAGGGRSRALALGSRRGLVVQLSLSMALFLGTALMVSSYRRAAAFDFGYAADSIASIGVIFDGPRYQAHASTVQFMEEVATGLRESGGLSKVGVWARLSFLRTRATSEAASNNAAATREVGWSLHADGVGPAINIASFHLVAIPDNYFDILSIHRVTGRDFNLSDRPDGAPVAIVSRSVAATLFNGANPIGRTLYQGPTGDRFTIVGVVEDVHDPGGGIHQSTVSRQVYVPVRQLDVRDPELLARGRDVDATKRLVVNAIRSRDPELTILDPSTLASGTEGEMSTIRIFGSMLGFFAASGLLLSVIGIYGVVSYGITQRTREIGIRMALGGTGSAIVRLLVRQGLGFTAIGIAIGIGIALATTKVLQRVIVGTSAFDAPVYILSALFFAGISMLACYLPARRAARVDPLVALRAE